MADLGTITRQLPPEESTSIITSIKVEENPVEDGNPTTQPGFSFSEKRKEYRIKNASSTQRLQNLDAGCGQKTADAERNSPLDYSIVQGRLRGTRDTTHTAIPEGGIKEKNQQSRFFVTSVAIGGELLQRWRQTGTAQGLATDAEIATFLLNFFEEAPEGHKTPDSPHLCSTCHTPLTLVCLTCNPAQTKHNNSTAAAVTQTTSDQVSGVSDYDSDDQVDDFDVPLTIDIPDQDEADNKAELEADQTLQEKVQEKDQEKDTSCSLGSPVEGDSRLSRKVVSNSVSELKDDYLTDTCFVKVLDIATKQAFKTLEEEGLMSVKEMQKLKAAETKKNSVGVKIKIGAKRPKARNNNGVKRRVGRPRKNHPTASIPETNADKSKEQVHVKRKRGRPKKEAAASLPENGEVDKKPFKCSVCSKAFKDRSNCRVHELNHDGGEKRHKCEHCPAAFRSPANLKAHRRKHTGERPFFCETCGKSFARTTTLEQHKRVHTNDRPYKCEQCGEGFKQRGLLIVHRRKAHTFERPFSCSICAASFVVKGHLSVHMQCHTGQRPFLCEECGASFKQKGILKVHKMIHKGIRPFSCDECGKSFYRQVDVRAHKKTHLNIRNVICTVCGAAFGNNSTLKRHMQSHTGFRPFNCSECGKNFASNSELKVHQRIHTGHKPYICDVCGRGFQTMGNMKKHRNNRHKHAPPYVASTQRMGSQMLEDKRVESYITSGQKSEPCMPEKERVAPPPPLAPLVEPLSSMSQRLEAVAVVGPERKNLLTSVLHRAQSVSSVGHRIQAYTSLHPKVYPYPTVAHGHTMESISSHGEI